MLNSTANIHMKLVDAFFEKNLDNLPQSLKKCQIPLQVEDCPTFVLQFDQQQLLFHQSLSCPKSLKNRVTTTTTTTTTSMRTNNSPCNLCNSISNSNKKDYEIFLNKYNKCSSSNANELDNESDFEDDDQCSGGEEEDEYDEAECNLCLSQKKSNSNNLEEKATTGCTCNITNGKRNASPKSQRKVSPHPRIVATQNDLMNTLSKLVSCIGCRASVERFYKQLVAANNGRRVNLLNLDKNMQRKNQFGSALDPFIIRSNGNLTIKRSAMMDPQLVYKLFYLNCSNLDQVIDQISKCKKTNKRCNLHSLEFTQKQKLINDWLQVWDAFENDECRAKSIIIDTSQLMATLDTYLRRHKFCVDCKMKVIRAFNILTGELDSSKEKGYCASLYDGIECCCIKNDQTNIELDPKATVTVTTSSKTTTTTSSSSSTTTTTPLNSTSSSSSSTDLVTTSTDAASQSNDTCDNTCTCNDPTILNSCCNQPNNQHFYHNHVNDGLFKNHPELHHHHHHHQLHNHSHNESEQTKSSSFAGASISGALCSPKSCKHTIATNKYKFHSNEQHLHLKIDKKFIGDLIFRAEPEIQGSRRERHAKTLDIAQEEVLTCIGIHLYERFHRIYQSMKTEEQTWQLLFYTSVSTLRKRFEVEFENLQGVSNIELLCAEFEALDESRQTRKRMKKERKKKNKLNNKCTKCETQLVHKCENSQSKSESLSSLLLSSTTSSSSTSSSSNNKPTAKQLKNGSPALTSSSKSKSKTVVSNGTSSSANGRTSTVVVNKQQQQQQLQQHEHISEIDSGNDFEEEDEDNDDDDEDEDDEDDEDEMEEVEDSSNEGEDEESEDEDDDCASKQYLNVSNCNLDNSTVSATALKSKQISQNLNELDDLDDPILFSSGSSRVTSSSSSSCSTTSLKNISSDIIPSNVQNIENSNFSTQASIENCNENSLIHTNGGKDGPDRSCSCFLLNQVYESYDPVNYGDDNNNYNGGVNGINEDLVLITDEEKNEYYANKSLYLTERKNRREMLKEKFQNFKLNQNFKIKPRNVS
jgi:hypothetical protein